MVYRETDECKTIAKKTNMFVLASLLGILIATCTLIGGLIVRGLLKTEPTPEPEPEPESQEIIDPPTQIEYPLIDFQPVVDDFVNSTSRNRSVIVYDVENDQIVGEYNPTETYSTASLYKLFVAYEGYRRLENGTWNPNDVAGRSGLTILECLDLAIRESKSECAEPLWSLIGHDELDSIIETDFDIHNSDISRLLSNPQDILKIMQIFYHHDDVVSEDLLTQMIDSFLSQPTTTYNWRQGLPSGFTRANVYNKVGWDYNPDGRYWNIYHDTAIIEFPDEERHYIVVVMTNKVPYQKITEFGQKFENYFYAHNQ